MSQKCYAPHPHIHMHIVEYTLFYNLLCMCMVLIYLQWLENDFLGFLSRWNESVQQQMNCTPAQKQTMLLSQQTMEGIQMTGMYMPIMTVRIMM